MKLFALNSVALKHLVHVDLIRAGMNMRGYWSLDFATRIVEPCGLWLWKWVWVWLRVATLVHGHWYRLACCNFLQRPYNRVIFRGGLFDRLCPPLILAEVARRVTFLTTVSGVCIQNAIVNLPNSCHKVSDSADEILNKSNGQRAHCQSRWTHQCIALCATCNYRKYSRAWSRAWRWSIDEGEGQGKEFRNQKLANGGVSNVIND